jgi:hypothetical protein
MHHYPPVLTIYCHHFESVAKWLVLSISLESAHFKEQFEGANVKKKLRFNAYGEFNNKLVHKIFEISITDLLFF